MSVDTVSNIMIRIRAAPPDSPIAVFRAPVPGKLEAVFASTVKAQDRIRGDKRHDLIGVFDKSQDLEHVKRVLHLSILEGEIA
jgi:hypothetical protein